MEISSNQLSASSSPYRILVVDDETSQRNLEKMILSKPQYLVYEARDGIEALAAIQAQDFDVVLLDKRMPLMDGDEVCRQIRGKLNLPLLPIIMVTGTNTLEDLAVSMQAGATDFIRKPYNTMELVARVNTAANYKRLTDQLDSAESMLFALARIVEAKDSHTGDHCTRLEHLSVVFGKALGLNDEQLLALRRGGVLHDIGKLGIPDNILLKQGPLTDTEWRVMRQHTVLGAQLCSGLRSMKLTIPIIRHHHERWDGTGYPDALRGEAIPLLARVFQIVDIYDALINVRPYKKAFSRGKTIATLQREMHQDRYDPALIDVFLSILRKRPEDLVVPKSLAKDLGAKIFDEIAKIGVLDWNLRSQ